MMKCPICGKHAHYRGAQPSCPTCMYELARSIEKLNQGSPEGWTLALIQGKFVAAVSLPGHHLGFSGQEGKGPTIPEAVEQALESRRLWSERYRPQQQEPPDARVH